MSQLLLRVICTVMLVGAGYYVGTHNPSFSALLVFVALVGTGNLLMITYTEERP